MALIFNTEVDLKDIAKAKNNGTSPSIQFQGNVNDTRSGDIFLANAGTGTANTYGQGFYRFRVFSPASDGASLTQVYEQYDLPVINVGRSSHGNYFILTTKDTVTVAQGGTGATTAADAVSNLGLGSLKYVGSTGGATKDTAYEMTLTGSAHYLIYAYRSANADSMGLYLLKTRMATSGTNYYNFKPILESSAVTSIEVTTTAGSANGKLIMTSAATNTYVALYRIL